MLMTCMPHGILKRIFITLLAFGFLFIAIPFNGVCDELTLDSAINMALEKNRPLLQSRYNRSASGWGVANAVSNWLPKASFITTWSKVDDETYDEAMELYGLQEQMGLNPERILWKNNYSSSIRVVQPIFNAGAEYTAIRAGAIDYKLNKYTTEDVHVQIIRDVKTAYHNAVKSRALFKVQRESLLLANNSLQLVRSKFEVGSATKSDVLRWEAQVAGTEGYLVNQENEYNLALIELARIIGSPLDAKWTLPAVDTQVSENELSIAKESEKAGSTTPLTINSHPSVAAMNQNVELTQVQVEGAVGRFLPNVNFTYDYAWAMDDSILPDDDTNWTMGINFEFPLFQGFGAITGVGQSAYQYKSGKKSGEEFNRNFLQVAYAAKMTIKAARLRLISARKAEVSSKENLEIITNRTDLGITTNLEQLDAQLAYQQARSDLISAISDLRIAIAQWEYVTAGKGS